MAPILNNLPPHARAILADLQAGKLTSPEIIAKHRVNAKTFYKWRARFLAAGIAITRKVTPHTFTPADRRRIGERTRRTMRRYWAEVRAGKRAKPRIGNAAYGRRPGEGEVVQLIIRLRRRPMTTPAIAAELNRRGLRARNGKPWRATPVQNVLNRYGGALAGRMFDREGKPIAPGDGTTPAPAPTPRPGRRRAREVPSTSGHRIG